MNRSASDATQALGIAALGVGVVMVFAAYVAVAGAVSAWALSLTWAWLIVPTFGLPALTLAQCYGVVLIGGFLAKQPNWKDKDSKWATATYPLWGPLIHVAFGYATYLLIVAGY